MKKFYKVISLVFAVVAYVEIYTLSTCRYCNDAKKFLKANNIEYVECEVTRKECTQSLIKMANAMGIGSINTVPQIFIGNTYIGGYDTMISLYKTDQLQKILDYESESERIDTGV